MGQSEKVHGGAATGALLNLTSAKTIDELRERQSARKKAFDKARHRREQAEQLAALRDRRIAYAGRLAIEGLDLLEINDIKFSMPSKLTPPSVIRIDKQHVNYKWQTLRTTASQKVSSGHANTRISMSLYFVGRDAINTGLRRLVATFKTLPFVYIENAFLRSNLLPAFSGEGETTDILADNIDSMACSLVNMTIRTEENLPNVLVADLDLMWFNYKPYSGGFWFRKSRDSVFEEDSARSGSLIKSSAAAAKAVYDSAVEAAEGARGAFGINTPVPVKRDPLVRYSSVALRPSESQPLLDYVKSKEGPLMPKLTDAISFQYKKLKCLPGPSRPSPIDKRWNAVRTEILQPVDSRYLRISSGRVDLRLRAGAASALEALSKKFYQNFNNKKLSVTSCFRSREEQARQRQIRPATAAPPGKSWHEAGLAVDISAKALTQEEWEWLCREGRSLGLVNLGYDKQITEEGYRRYVEEEGRKVKEVVRRAGTPLKSNPNNPNQSLWEVWHFDYSPGQAAVRSKYKGKSGKAVTNAITELYIPQKAIDDPELREGYEKARRVYESKLDELIEEQEITGWLIDPMASSSNTLVFYKERYFNVADDDEFLIPQGIAIFKHNVIANLPIASHEFSTQQYLGSTDMDAVVSFIAVGTEKLERLQGMVKEVQGNARAARAVRDAAVIVIDNPIFHFLGFDEALVESITAQSIPGSPNTYNVALQLTQYTRTEPALQQEQFIAGNAWLEVAKWVYDHIFVGVSLERQTFSEPMPEITTDDAFAQVYGIHLRASRYDEGGREGGGGALSLAGYLKNVAGGIGKTLGGYVGNAARLPGTYWEDWDSPLTFSRASYRKEVLKRLPGLQKWDSLQKFPYAEIRHQGDIGSAIASKEGTLWEALLLYSQVLLEATLVGVPAAFAKGLGIHNKLAAFGRDSLRPDGTVTEEDERYYAAWQRGLVRAYNMVLSELIHLPTFRPLGTKIQAEIDTFYKGLECYPDLGLPEAVGGSVLNTDPDFYFYNEAIDGDLGLLQKQQEVFAAAKIIVDNTYESHQRYITKDWYNKTVISPNKTNDTYNDPTVGTEAKPFTDKEELKKRAAAFLNEGQCLPRHAISIPSEKIKKVLEHASGKRSFNYNKYDIDQSTAAIGEGVTMGGSGKVRQDESKVPSDSRAAIAESLEASFNSFNDQTYRMARAFPTFKIYFIEDDSAEPFTLKYRNFDDFYSYSAIKDIRVVRSRKIPADLCVITMTNVHGQLDTLNFTSEGRNNRGMTERFDPSTVNTKLENPFQKLVVMEGSKIQVRLGYSNDPDKLETVFNGQVVEVGQSEVSSDLIQIVCQSYAVELLGDMKNSSETGSFTDTQELLSSMICSPEITHFGRWQRTGEYAPGEIRTSRSGSRSYGLIDSRIRTYKEIFLRAWKFLNKPQDDNVFAPDRKTYETLYDEFLNAMDAIGFKDPMTALWDVSEMTYYPDNSTVWDIFKEMELRHPGFIASPVPFEQRYTMFFGPPSHKYWARSQSIGEKEDYNRLSNRVKAYMDSAQTRAQIAKEIEVRYERANKTFGPVRQNFGGREQAVEYGQTEGMARKKSTEDVTREFEEKYREQLEWEIQERYGRFKPFRNYFLMTSENHIVANNITASSHGTHNAVELTHIKDTGVVDLLEKHQKTPGDIDLAAYESFLETLKMKADDNISDKNTRVLQAVATTCFGSYYARRYAVGLLMRSLRDVYKGTLITTGEPKLKAYDVVFVYDTYRDMFGPVEVEQVQHIFSQETGFITEIKPDLVVSHNQLTTASTLDAMGYSLNHYFGEASAAVGTGAVLGGISAGGLLGGVIGLGIAAYGGYKFVQWTQERQPIVLTPLTVGYKPLIAGLDGYKYDSLYVNLKGKWRNFKTNFEDGWKTFWENDPIEDWALEHASDWLA
jgi:hypothetical protein